MVAKAVEAPLNQIAVNAGLEGGVIVDKVRNLKKATEGLNAATGDYETSSRPASSTRRR